MKIGQSEGWREGQVRQGGSIGGDFVIDDLVVNVGRREVRRGEQLLSLPGHSFDFLMALVRIAPDIATAEYLSDTVWDGRPVSPETITQRAKLLRDALGDDSRQPRYVAVVRGQGYRLIPAIGQARPDAGPRSRRVTGWLIPILLLAGVITWQFGSWPGRSASDAPEPPAYRQALAKMERHTPAALNAAVEGFSDALGEHPEFVPAHVGLARTRLLQARYRMLDRQVALRLAENAIERAIQLDPDHAPAHAARANLLSLRGDTAGAEAAFQQALNMDAGLAPALIDYGFLLLNDPVNHRPYEAIDLWRRAARLEPESEVSRAHLAWTDFRAGHFDRAEGVLRAILASSADQPVAHFVLAELLLASGRQAEAVTAYRRLLELNAWFAPLAWEGLFEALIDLEMDAAASDVVQQARSMPDDGGLVLLLEVLEQMLGYQADPSSRAELLSRVERLRVSRPSQAIWLEAWLHRLHGDDALALEVMETGEPRLLQAPGGLPMDGYWRVLVCPYAQLLVEHGEVERGEAIARWLLRRIESGPDFSRLRHLDPIACHTAIGETDRALAVLAEAAAEGVPSGWRFLGVRPELRALLDHPGFPEVIEDIAQSAAEQRQLLTGPGQTARLELP
jgi:DNA-binding winged helix-turn-helix (wHTH) protein/Tfp pilus assembly protein PilF